jgi:SPP1 family predicted phage head-tail adaptor
MADRVPCAGDLRHRVTWQVNAPARTPASAGQKLNNWTDRGTFWARVEPLSGRELWTARQLQASTTLRITMRAIGPVKPGDRLVFADPAFGARYLYVEAVHRLDERNALLMIEASEPKDHA